jgi:hypothetical protein
MCDNELGLACLLLEDVYKKHQMLLPLLPVTGRPIWGLCRAPGVHVGTHSPPFPRHKLGGALDQFGTSNRVLRSLKALLCRTDGRSMVSMQNWWEHVVHTVQHVRTWECLLGQLAPASRESFIFHTLGRQGTSALYVEELCVREQYCMCVCRQSFSTY